MDAGLAAIIASIISTIVGGILVFISSYLTSNQANKHARSLAHLPRQAESIEYISLVIFKTLAGEKQDNKDWDKYIMCCLWLPTQERNICLSILQDRENVEKLKLTQKVILDLIDKLIS